MSRVSAVTMCLLAACCGGTKQVVLNPVDIIVADSIPQPLPQLRLPTSAGPLIELEPCGTELKAMLASLAQHHAAASASNATLFRNLDEKTRCESALTALASCQQGDQNAVAQIQILNECVVAAAADSTVGPRDVQAALGKGRLRHVQDTSCAGSTQVTAQTITALPRVDGDNMIFGLLPVERQAFCMDVAVKAATQAPDCTQLLSYRLDACLIEVDAIGAQSRRLVAAVIGAGVAAHEVVSDVDGSIKGCPSVLKALDEASDKTNPLTPAADSPDAVNPLALTGVTLGIAGGVEADRFVDRTASIGGDADARQQCATHLETVKKRGAKCNGTTASDVRIIDACTVAQALGFRKDKTDSEDNYLRLLMSREAAVTYSFVGASVETTTPSPVVPMPSLPSQSTVINGLADFLVSRAAEEVQQTLATEFTNRICNKTWDGIAVNSYFAETCRLLKGRFLDGSVNLRSFGSAVQRAVENDLVALLPTLLNAAHSSVPPRVAALVAAAVQLAPTNPNFGDFFKRAAETFPCKPLPSGAGALDSDLGCAFHLLHLLWTQTPVATVKADPLVVAWLGAHPKLDVATLSAAVTALVTGAQSSPIKTLERLVVLLQQHLEPGDLKASLEPIRIALHEYSPALDTVIRAVPTLMQQPRDVNAFFDAFSTLTCGAVEATTSADHQVGCAMRLITALWARHGEPVEAAVNAVLADPELKPWVDAFANGRLQGLATELRAISAELDHLDAFELLERVVGALHHNLNNTIIIAAIEARLGPLRSRFTGIGRLGYVMFYAGRALLQGENPAPIIVSATQQITCNYAVDTFGATDVPCALALTGVTLGVFLETRHAWNTSRLGPSQLTAYLGDVERRISRVLAARGDQLVAWTRYRFGQIGRLALSTHERQNIRTFTSSLFQTLRSFEALLHADDEASKDDTVAVERRVDQLIAVGTTFFRTVVENAVLEETVRKRALRVLDHSSALIRAAYHRKLPAFAAELYALADDLGMPEPLPASMREYVPLMTALASAKTAEEVKAAFEKYASPSDSYKKKRLRGLHISVNGIVGVAGGMERGFDATPGTAGSFGVFAPVGVDIVFGGCRACGFMASVLDLGAVASVRLSGDDASTTKDVTWSQVLSPGLSAKFALGGPFVLGAGATIAPGVRQSADGKDHTIWRALIYLGVDVPIISLR